MKKLVCTAIMALSTVVSATTIQISGLENVSKATAFDMHFNVVFGQCDPTQKDYNCKQNNIGGKGYKIGVFDSILDRFNHDYRDIQLIKNAFGEESFMSIQFKEYSSTCMIPLSNKQSVLVNVQADGSCVFN